MLNAVDLGGKMKRTVLGATHLEFLSRHLEADVLKRVRGATPEAVNLRLHLEAKSSTPGSTTNAASAPCSRPPTSRSWSSRKSASSWKRRKTTRTWPRSRKTATSTDEDDAAVLAKVNQLQMKNVIHLMRLLRGRFARLKKALDPCLAEDDPASSSTPYCQQCSVTTCIVN